MKNRKELINKDGKKKKGFFVQEEMINKDGQLDCELALKNIDGTLFIMFLLSKMNGLLTETYKRLGKKNNLPKNFVENSMTVFKDICTKASVAYFLETGIISRENKK